MLGISKRGNLSSQDTDPWSEGSCGTEEARATPFGAWLNALQTRAPLNVVVTATANELARIAWAVLSSGEEFRAAASTLSVQEIMRTSTEGFLVTSPLSPRNLLK